MTTNSLKKINPHWVETAEIKNGRLAMIAITGFSVQEFVSGNAAVRIGLIDTTYHECFELRNTG